MNVFVCRCGMKTTAPFLVGGRWMCTLCAEDEHPGLVNRRAREEFSHLERGERRRYKKREERRWGRYETR